MFSNFSPIIYIQLSPGRLTIRDVRKGVSFSETPELAIESTGKETILAIGNEARRELAGTPTARIVNPFAHPRTLISDFTTAEQLIKEFMFRVLGRKLFSFAPRIIIHPLGQPAGGFTQVEIRALRELAIAAGAAETTVWQGRILTDSEMLAHQFPTDGTILA